MSARILDSCARLHNYVINEKIIDNAILDGSNQILTEIIPVSLSPLGWLGLLIDCGTVRCIYCLEALLCEILFLPDCEPWACNDLLSI